MVSDLNAKFEPAKFCWDGNYPVTVIKAGAKQKRLSKKAAIKLK